ncbi:hydrolase [Acuticoccus sediminis]|uniref:Hydrolase n=1 Tax=Acuticoccus sediminis TaxID=2184697 RepID=A0A8B2NPD9_9HYPH|nr:fumarylacetoacetate hydrolase family protein [Acuticoccus sediminis]RAI01765.1 hydrolase [Acuticoccus sediminis]
MKLVTCRANGTHLAGVLEGEEIAVCREGAEARTALRDLVANGGDVAAFAASATRRVPLAEVELTAPFPAPVRDIFCVGKNYYEHAREFHDSGFDSSGKEATPTAPIIFTKATTSVVGPGDTVKASLDPTSTVDYEGELGLVIGKRAFQVPAADAYDVVFGYVIINDVTSRELQRKHNQWVIGKGIDTFCPMGPWLVTADEVGDVTALELTTTVNGETRQSACVRDLIFDIPTLIETLSATMTLLPGDIIATGTPVGVGIGFSPPKYLAPGDVVKVAISKLGELTNPIG